MEKRMSFEIMREEVDGIVCHYLPEEDGAQKTVLRAMNYSIQAGGKRLRPMMMREVYRLFGGAGQEIEPFMAAIEMIHTSSLIHDDLPCMDNDRYRRGKLTAWAVYGEDMGTLAGDGLMIYAFETAAKALPMTDSPEKVLRCMEILARKTGVYGMIGGQTADVELTGKKIPMDTLSFIYRLKTGALLEASMMIGAVMAGASEENVRKVEQMAGDVGLAFQIEDDILDMTGTTEEIGKPSGSDERNEKTTWVTEKGLSASRAEAEKLSAEALAILQELPGSNPFLEELIRKLVNRKK